VTSRSPWSLVPVQSVGDEQAIVVSDPGFRSVDDKELPVTTYQYSADRSLERHRSVQFQRSGIGARLYR
jgi:hypothetical protein